MGAIFTSQSIQTNGFLHRNSPIVYEFALWSSDIGIGVLLGVVSRCGEIRRMSGCKCRESIGAGRLVVRKEFGVSAGGDVDCLWL